MRRGLFVFHRDLRLDDNIGLLRACEACDEVLPCFIVDPAQADGHRNPYRGEHAVRFLAGALLGLRRVVEEAGGTLSILSGDTPDVLRQILSSDNYCAVYANRDYTPFARRRGAALREICASFGVPLHLSDDALLQPPEAVHKENGAPYTVFTPFWRKHASLPVAAPKRFRGALSLEALAGASNDVGTLFGLSDVPKADVGRLAALRTLSSLEDFRRYATLRDIPSLDATTHLSAHLKFGTCSPREAFAAIAATLGSSHPLLRQLAWRDFCTHIAFHFPHVFGAPFHRRYDALAWSNDSAHLAAWTEGRTGFPLVDAGMRELATTGFMHNRLRMITSSFLVKDLRIDWRMGERHFARFLTDYDPSVNNGNWQWAASTGCDAVPYFRVFNPWVQQRKFDPDCAYIKRFVPELSALPARAIHQWNEERPAHHAYPAPMVDHAVASAAVKAMFAACAASRRRECA